MQASIWYSPATRSENSVGGLKNFDHATILREDDPLLPALLGVYEAQGIKDSAPNNTMKGPAFKTELATAYPGVPFSCDKRDHDR